MTPFWRRNPEPVPVPQPPAPETVVPEKIARDPLEFLGAEFHGLPQGCWVYNLHQADGTIFYIGQSENLISRLRDHIYKYGKRLHHYSTISCRDEYQMDLIELFLIDWYQPAENKSGTTEVENLRRRVNQAGSIRNLNLDSLKRAGNQ